MAKRITLDDFELFKQVLSVEYLYDTLELEAPHLNNLRKFLDTSNKEMFWVVTELLSERNPVRRVRILKRFLQIASVFYFFLHFFSFEEL